MTVPAALIDRYRRLFRFYDRDGDGRLSLEHDFTPVAHSLADRCQGGGAPLPNLLTLLLGTYAHEQQRRDTNGDGVVELEEFIASHQETLRAFQAEPEHARGFIERAAGGCFDVLDRDGDGVLDLTDLQAFAAAYGHPVEGIATNLAAMLAELGLPPERLPRQAFLTLVEQYWFDPSPAAPGRRLFSGMGLDA